MNYTKIFALSLIVLLLSGLGLGFWMVSGTDFGIEDQGSWKITENAVGVESSIWIDYNGPIDVDISWLEIDLDVYGNDVLLITGSKDGLSIEEGNNTVSVNADLVSDNFVDWWINHINNEEVTELEVDSKVYANNILPLSFEENVISKEFDTDIEEIIENNFESFEGAYEYDSGYPRDEEIIIRNVDVDLGEVDQENTEIVVDMRIMNMNDYPIPVPDFEGFLRLNDFILAEWNDENVEFTEAPSDRSIAPGEQENIVLSLDINNENLVDWFRSHVSQEEFTEGELELDLFFDFEEDGRFYITGEGMNCEIEFTTNILINQESYSESGNCSMEGSPYYDGDRSFEEDDFDEDDEEDLEDLL